MTLIASTFSEELPFLLGDILFSSQDNIIDFITPTQIHSYSIPGDNLKFKPSELSQKIYILNDNLAIALAGNKYEMKTLLCQLKSRISYFNYISKEIIDIKKIFEVLKFESVTYVYNKVLDFNPVYTCKVYIPKNIPNTKKRKTYRNIIHNLVYLNPTAEPIYIYSYLYFINRYHAQPSMLPEKLLEFFRFIYVHIINTETVKPTLKLKRIHFNRSCTLSKEKKNDIANKLNGLYKRKLKIDLINDAKEELQILGLDITTKAVSNLTGVKLRSVQLYFKHKRIDFDLEIQNINNTYKSIT
jgi:hypothetical protein